MFSGLLFIKSLLRLIPELLQLSNLISSHIALITAFSHTIFLRLIEQFYALKTRPNSAGQSGGDNLHSSLHKVPKPSTPNIYPQISSLCFL